MNAACRDLISLNMLPGLGPVRIKKLLEHFGGTEEIFRTAPHRLEKIAGVGKDLSGKILSARTSTEFLAELDHMEKDGIKAVSCLDEDYPASLGNIYDPPAVIFYKGEILRDDARAVAIVGSRRCSAYGMRTAERLAGELADMGITVVSGMARGIDLAAHRGALRRGGRTIAVMGSGFRHIYPPEAVKDARDIASGGALVTEHPSGAVPHKGNFPRRNRIISGLALGVVVVEASEKSGALITVDFALEQGKEVFAVPGAADRNTGRGANRLIQDGAGLVMDADDIMRELNIPERVERMPGTADAHPGKDRIFEALSGGAPVHIDTISNDTGIGLKELSRMLLELELKGRVETVPGARYSLKTAG